MIVRRMPLLYCVEYITNKREKKSFYIDDPLEIAPISERLAQARKEGVIKKFNIYRKVI